MADSRVQLEVGVNCRQVVSFCPTILSEKRTTKTSKTSKKGSGIRFYDPPMRGSQKRIPPSSKLIDIASRTNSWGSLRSLWFAVSLSVCRVRKNRHYPAQPRVALDGT